MELTVVGCTGSMPGPDSPASCYLVEHEGFRVVLDLGNGALGALMREVDLADVDAVVLSHLHPDHCLDLTGLYVAHRYGGYSPGRRVPVYGPAGTADRLARAYGPDAATDLGAVLDVQLLPALTELGPFTVSTAPMDHPVEAYATRLDADDVALVYSGDTGPTPQLERLARGADLLLAEASFSSTDRNPPHLHLTGAEAGEAATAAGVDHLVVTHIPPWMDAEAIHAEAAAAFDGPVTAATPGARFAVGR